jgi:uncharacterized protein
LEQGDIVIAYLKEHGYVGIGRVKDKAVKVLDFRYEGKSLRDIPLKMPNIFEHCDNDKSEYLASVDWIKTVNSENAKWKPKARLFTTQLIKASLQYQTQTINFLEKEFEISFSSLSIDA